MAKATPRKSISVDPRQSKPSADTGAAGTNAPLPPQQAAGAANIAKGLESDESITRRQTTTEKALWARYREPVKVEVKTGFNFTREDHTMVRYEPGNYEMPRGHAEDSFAQAHGVTIKK